MEECPPQHPQHQRPPKGFEHRKEPSEPTWFWQTSGWSALELLHQPWVRMKLNFSTMMTLTRIHPEKTDIYIYIWPPWQERDLLEMFPHSLLSREGWECVTCSHFVLGGFVYFVTKAIYLPFHPPSEKSQQSTISSTILSNPKVVTPPPPSKTKAKKNPK